MTGAKLRIGLIAAGFGAGTGPATYYEALMRALSGRCELVPIADAGDTEADVVHVVDAKRLDPRRLRTLAAPVVLDYHDDYWLRPVPYPAPDRLLRTARNWQLRRRHLDALGQVRHAIVHSRAVAAALAAALSGSGPRVHTVPYGIEAAPARSIEAGAGRPEKIILFVGRDLFRKGFPVLLQALPRVLAAHPEARLVAIGREYFHTRLAAQTLSRGLPVEFLPVQSRPALGEWYGRAAALALPSWEEAFGLVLLEAMAAGVPVVATRVGGIAEAVEDGVKSQQAARFAAFRTVVGY